MGRRRSAASLRRAITGSLAGALLTTTIAPREAAAASLCFGPDATAGATVTIDCDQINPMTWAFRWRGFADDPADSCAECPAPSTCNGSDLILDGCACSYAWSLSASATDPDRVLAPVPPDGWLYLWLTGTIKGGAAALVFRPTGTLVPVEFELLRESALWLPERFPDLWIAIGGCPVGPTVIGRIRVQDPSPVRGRTWGRTKAMYR